MMRNIVKQNIYALITPLTVLASGLVVYLLFPRFLSLTDFGVFNTILAFAVLFSTIGGLGVPNTLIKFAGGGFQSKDGHAGFYVRYLLTWNMFALVVVCLVLLLFPSQLAQLFLHDARLSYVVQAIVVLTILYSVNQFVANLFVSLGRFGYPSIISLMLNGTKAVFPLILVLVIGPNLMAIVLGVLLSFLVTAIASIVLLKLRFKEDLSYSPVNTRKLNSFLFYSTILSWATIMLLNIDSLMLNYFLGPSELAVFSVSNSVVLFIISLLPISSLFLLSFLVQMEAKGERALQNRLFGWSMKYGLLVAIPLTFLVYLTSNRIVSFLWPSTYAPAATTLKILCILIPFKFLSDASSTIFMSKGKMRALAFNTVVYYLFTFAIGLYLIPTYGLGGTALTFVLSQVLQCAVLLLFSLRMLRMKFNFSYILKPLLPSLVVAVLIILLNSYFMLKDTIPLFIISGVVFAVVYIPLLDADDKKLANTLLSFVKLGPIFS